MPRIWIDLTDLTHWGGQHGGTQRVVYGIAEALHRLIPGQVGYVRYVAARDRFVETSIEPIIARANSPIHRRSGEPHRSRVIRTGFRVWHRITKDRPELKLRGHYIARWSVHDLRRARARVRDTIGRQPSPVAFSADDVFLVLGKPWDDPGLQDRLERDRREVGFSVVELVYDLIPALTPLHDAGLLPPYARQMFKQAQSSERLIAISESTKHDYEEFCRRLALSSPPIDVIRIADKLDLDVAGPDDGGELPAGVASEFILCVGTIEVRKNHLLLYQAVKLAAERGIALPQVVIVGGRGWLVEETWNLLTRDRGISGSVVILEDVDDSELRRLYRRSLFTVYPSMYEGWGLPVAEALAYGKAVAASSASSIPEIGGDLVSYFSPYSADECLAAMLSLLDDETRASAEERIAREYVVTSWEDTANQVLQRLTASGIMG